jgi:hypothetical protein
MDWQLAIAINVMALSAFSVVFGLLRWRQADKTFLATHTGILLVGAAGLYSGFGARPWPRSMVFGTPWAPLSTPEEAAAVIGKLKAA